MTKLLEMIGCPDRVINMIPDIVATCRVCRTWTRKAPDTKLSTRISIRFNQCVQDDLMFYECAATPLGSSSSMRPPTSHIILHISDERIRWPVAIDRPDKTRDEFIDAITTHWLQLYGKPELMIWDGERALVILEASQWASHSQFQLIQRIKHRKPWDVERHNEILRHSLQTCQTQLVVEGLGVKCRHALADAVYSKHALLSIGERTPYVALLGRVPLLLPQLEHVNGSAWAKQE